MDKFGFISKEMDSIAVPYEIEKWTGDVVYPYFLGEFTEDAVTTGDGKETSTLVLDGFHRGKRIDLERAKAKIKKHFDPLHGLIGEIDGGYIAVFFDGAFYVPTNEADLEHIRITLKIKEWKV